MADTLFDCLLKLAAPHAPPSDADALQALERIRDLEANKPTREQMLRYGTLGGISGLAVPAIGEVLRGNVPFAPTKAFSTRGKAIEVGRNLAASFTTGALGGGVLPLVRHHVDRDAEMSKLRQFVAARQQAPAALPTNAPTPVAPPQSKLADGRGRQFLTGLKDGVGSIAEYVASTPTAVRNSVNNVRFGEGADAVHVGDILLGAHIGRALPIAAAGTAAAGGAYALGRHHGAEKKASVPTTPAGRLAHSKAVGRAPGSIDAGPSIADQVKPIGYGRPMPGATKA